MVAGKIGGCDRSVRIERVQCVSSAARTIG